MVSSTRPHVFLDSIDVHARLHRRHFSSEAALFVPKPPAVAFVPKNFIFSEKSSGPLLGLTVMSH
jgi:hypothetical protein